MLPLRLEGEALTKKDDEVIDNIIREIFGPDINLDYIDKDAVSRSTELFILQLVIIIFLIYLFFSSFFLSNKREIKKSYVLLIHLFFFLSRQKKIF